MGRDLHDTRVTAEVPKRIRPALAVLLEAIEYAEQTDSDHWEFAVEIDRLMALKLDLNDFRWLVRKKLVEHQREVTSECDNGRAFRPSGDLTFPDASCFVLTEKGISLARDISPRAVSEDSIRHVKNGSGNGNHNSMKASGALATNGGNAGNGHCLPKWDPERRLLTVNGSTVKHFKWTAPNQEAILAAFEEEGWPAHVDDPLPPHAEQDSKRRLSDTIKCLNRKQREPLIQFHGDGTGEGVVWEILKQPNIGNGSLER